MKTWICKVCGYAHHGDEAPERCQQCGATKSQFRQTGGKKNYNIMALFFGFMTICMVVIFCIFACCSTSVADNSTVKEVDIYKYQGKWYEIARFDNRFERGMERCIATYTLQKNGTVKVVNQGMRNGKWKSSVGKAKLTNEAGRLRVSFWRPFYSDYRILALAPDYSYALVGGDDDDYLWILSRTPHLRKEVRDSLVNEAQQRGYKTEKFVWVSHNRP